MINNLSLNGGLNFNPSNSQFQPQIGFSTDLLSLSPKLIIAVGVGLIILGVYQYYQKKESKEF